MGDFFVDGNNVRARCCNEKSPSQKKGALWRESEKLKWMEYPFTLTIFISLTKLWGTIPKDSSPKHFGIERGNDGLRG